MSQKVTKKDTSNLRCLLLQILFTLLFCTVLIIYAIATRPSTLATYQIMKESYSHLARASATNTMSYALTDVSTALEALRNQLQLQNEEPKQEEAPMIKADIYDSYVYEIVNERYPSLDPQLVRAIIYHESRYEESAVNSSTSATGLMQLIPKWHKARAEALGVTDLTDPYGNILTGCDLLNELLANYPYSYALDLYAGGYNYAQQNKGGTSNYVRSVHSIMNGLADGTIIPGGG